MDSPGAEMSCRPGCDHHVHSPHALGVKIANLVANNKSAVLGNFGPTGSGKSEGQLVLGIQVQERLHTMGLLKDPSLSIRRQVAFKPVDRKPLAQALPRFKVVFDDEASGEGGHKHRTMSTANVDNAQDLDACRGRQQPNFFATPYMKRLSDAVVDHLMGYLEWSTDHSCEYFEAIRGGDQWKPTVWWESRFTVEGKDVPWLQALYPREGREYLDAKDDHMNGRNPNATETVLLEDRFYSLLRLTPLGKPRIPA